MLKSGWLGGVIVLVICAAADVFAQAPLFPEPLSPRIANYDIDVRLEPSTRMLQAHEILTWHNKTADTIADMQFHLYLNGFRNSRSTFMRESGGRYRGRRIEKDGFGYCEVTKITMAGGYDLTGRMQFIHPDNDDADDRTVFRLPLPKPLLPGETVVLSIDFTAKLPQPPFARTGAKQEFFFVGQWFPKAGVYQAERHAWNCHQFHLRSEFFADYGVYNVRITVPAKNLVGAVGLEQSVTDNGDGTATHFYHAEDVHDFAWTTSPEYKEFFAEQNGVRIRLLLQPDHLGQAQRHLDAAKIAIEYFEKWYGDYPFPNLTVVDPRRGAGGAGGMEYPTLITAGTTYGLPEGIRTVEMTIVHEFGHNYWYHLLASNEFEESWMDEGINSYTEARIMRAAYGPASAVDYLGIKLDDWEYQRAAYLGTPDFDPTVRAAWEYYNDQSYGINSYVKPAIFLYTLENYLGAETMLKCMQAYVQRWRFKHPTSSDFIQVFNETSGQDLDWFFDQALYSRAKLDYAVDGVASVEVEKGRGFDFDMGLADNTSTNGEEKAMAEHREDSTGRTDSAAGQGATPGFPKLYRNEVRLRRLGDFIFPVELSVKFDNGEELREQWDGRELWKKFRYERAAKLVSATIDPERKIWLDVNMMNNSKTLASSSLGADKLAGRWMFWMQFLLDSPASLGVLQRLLRF